MLPKKNIIATQVSMEAGLFSVLANKLRGNPQFRKNGNSLSDEQFSSIIRKTFLNDAWLEKNVPETLTFEVEGSNNLLLSLAGKEGEITAKDLETGLNEYSKWIDELLKPEVEYLKEGNAILKELNKTSGDENLAFSAVSDAKKKYETKRLKDKAEINKFAAKEHRFKDIFTFKSGVVTVLKPKTVSISRSDFKKVLNALFRASYVEPFQRLLNNFDIPKPGDGMVDIYEIEDVGDDVAILVDCYYLDEWDDSVLSNGDPVIDYDKLFNTCESVIEE